ncbi:MAG: dienelactone hydrolase family protein, partial [Pseudomonadota bacterium]
LAEAGFVAFAPDMYGGGVTTTDPKQAGEWAGACYGDKELWRRRATAGLQTLASRPEVDGDRVAAIGFCFGGSTAMQLAYAGADLDAVVSFHGGLEPAGDGEAEAVQPELLILHGGADPLVPAEKAAAFVAPLKDAGVTMTFVEFAGAKHAFSNPAADSYGLPPVGYDARAAEQSWSMCVATLERVLAK